MIFLERLVELAGADATAGLGAAAAGLVGAGAAAGLGAAAEIGHQASRAPTLPSAEECSARKEIGCEGLGAKAAATVNSEMNNIVMIRLCALAPS